MGKYRYFFIFCLVSVSLSTCSFLGCSCTNYSKESTSEEILPAQTQIPTELSKDQSENNSEPESILSAKIEAVNHFDKANEFLKMGKYEQAISQFNEAIKLDQNNALYYNCRGIAYNLNNEHNEAIVDFTKAIDLGIGNQAFVWYFRGMAYLEIGEYDKAIVDLTKCIELDPKYGMSYILRSAAYYQTGNSDKAADDLEKSKKCDPNYVFQYLE